MYQILKVFEPFQLNYEFFQNLTQHHVQYLTPICKWYGAVGGE